MHKGLIIFMLVQLNIYRAYKTDMLVNLILPNIKKKIQDMDYN